MPDTRIELREEDEGAWFVLNTGERIFVNVTEHGFSIRIASDRSEVYITPVGGNAATVTTEKAIAAKQDYWARIMAARAGEGVDNA